MTISKVRHDVCAVFCHCDKITVTHAAVAVEICRWFKIEGHPCFQHIRGKRVNSRPAVRVGCRESDSMPGSMLKCRTQTTSFHNGSGRVIYVPAQGSWFYGAQSG